MPKKSSAPKKAAPKKAKSATVKPSEAKATKDVAQKQPVKKPAAKPADSKRASAGEKHLHYHKDGSLWARGEKLGDELHGYWEWYRKDGTRMRSGHFEHGVQCGEWITYDKAGKVYKVTQIKPKK